MFTNKGGISLTLKQTSTFLPLPPSLPSSMASYQGGCFSLLSFLILVTSLAQVCTGGPATLDSDSAKKVSVDLYYEALCLDSAEFILDEVGPIFGNGLIDIVNLKLYPWGNARIRADNSIVCQHGPPECLHNTIQACAIEAYPSLDEHFPFIYCVEKLFYKERHADWKACLEALRLDVKPVIDCYSSGHGKELELKYAAETDALRPPHKYVPWVVVDGQPIYEDYGNFTSYICKAYKGHVPFACGGDHLAVLKHEAKHARPARYVYERAEVPFFGSIPSSVRSWVLQMIDRAGM